jgi:hypothetical protein
MAMDTARRTTGAILLRVAVAGAALLALAFFVDVHACPGGGPTGCGPGDVPASTNLLVGIVAGAVVLGAGIPELWLKRRRR